MKEFIKRSLFVVALVLLLGFLYYIRYLFIYVALAVIFAYLLSVPVEFFVRHRVPRGLAIILVFILFAVFIGLIIVFSIPIINDEGRQFLQDMPGYISAFEAKVNEVMENIQPGYKFVLTDTIENWVNQLQADAPLLFRRTLETIRGAMAVFLGLILVPLMVYYFLKDSHRMKLTFKKLFPKAYDQRIEAGLSKVNVMLGNYVRGRLILALFVGALISISLTLMRVKYPLLLGVLAGIAEFVPVAGPIIAYCVAGILAIGQGTSVFVGVTILYILANLIETYLVAPKVMSETMDLHPLTVIVAMLIGAYIAGILGLLIALPLVAGIKIFFEIFVVRREEFGIPLTVSSDLSGESANPSSGNE